MYADAYMRQTKRFSACVLPHNALFRPLFFIYNIPLYGAVF